jgi:hypothetical protein
MMRRTGKLACAGIVIFALSQLLHPTIPTSPATAEFQAPPEVRSIIEQHCYSCHSDQRRLSWFDEIVPGYWLVRHDILTARRHLNFSTLGSAPASVQKATLYEAVNMIQLGAMPLPGFTKLHPDARVTPDELSTLKAYLSPWSFPPSSSATSPQPVLAPISLPTVSPEFNGFLFAPGFEGWKLISTTDRGDNNTFRFILGNDIAFRSAQSGHISPWPDGSEFAKIAWQQVTGADGLVHPGAFIQVELMLKDARRFRQTDGWGWGRWRGVNLRPYGKDAHFVDECTSCHQPVRGDDYVYTLPITAAPVSREEIVNKDAAALPAGLPFQPLSWNPITMLVDPRTHTTATLFGNETAMLGVHARGAVPAAGPMAHAYPAGAVLTLVTWVQRDDPHWFGGRIPASPQSVEFVQVAANGQASYRQFSGAALTEDQAATQFAEARTRLILSLAPAQLP